MGRYKQRGKLGGMLVEFHKKTNISWETIPDGRSSCTETTSTKCPPTPRQMQLSDTILFKTTFAKSISEELVSLSSIYAAIY